jgi:hypothetical protein
VAKILHGISNTTKLTQHVAYDKTLDVIYEKLEKSQVIFLGNNTTRKIFGQGKFSIQL